MKLVRNHRGRLLLFLLLGLFLWSCAAEKGPSDDSFRVIMVFDMAGLGDKGFNDMGWAGVQRAVDELGVTASYIQSSEQGDYVPNLMLAAQQAELVVAMGFLMIEALGKVAPLFPETKFVFVDGEVKGDNIASYDFKAEEGAFLAGILSAMVSKTGKVGAVMGMDIPPVRAYEVGFRAGIMAVNTSQQRDVTYHAATVGDFNDPARGKALAQGLIGQGSDIVLQVAGNSGLGVIEAVKHMDGVYAIGADMDQDDLVPRRILTSILKRIDLAVLEAIQQASVGRFRSGHRWLGASEQATSLTDFRHTSELLPGRWYELVERAEKWMEDNAVPRTERELQDFDPRTLLIQW